MGESHGQKHFDLSTEQVDQIRRLLPEAVVETDNAFVVLQSIGAESGILHWSADSPEALVAALATLQRQVPGDTSGKWKITIINQAPYANALLSLGFQVHSHYLDHWLTDLHRVDSAITSTAAIREAQATDAERLAAISGACGEEKGWIANSAEWYATWLADSDSAVHAAEATEELVGLCCVRLYGDGGNKVWIRELAVHPDHRRTGLGRSLLEMGLRWARDRGAAKAFLAVDSRSTAARHLYTSIGFLPNGEEEFNLTLMR